MYTSASATGSTSSVSMVPGPVLSKSVRNELLPVLTSPPPGLLVLPSGFRSDGKALVMPLMGPSSETPRRRRMTTAPTMAAMRTPPPIAIHIALSASVSMKLGSGVGAAFFGAGLLASAGFGWAGFGAAAVVVGGVVVSGFEASGLVASAFATSVLAGSGVLVGSTFAG